MKNPNNILDNYELALDALTKDAPSCDVPLLVMKLRKAFPTAAPAALNLAAESYIARRLAPEKLGEWARGGFFSTSLLQQASRSAIATYRAAYFRGRKRVLEIGTGTGSDTAALAREAEHVTTIEEDPLASELAQRNLALLGITNVTFITGAASEIAAQLDLRFDALFADPMRRTRGGERIKSGEDYSPPLSFLLNLDIGTLRAIKVSPGLFLEPPPSGWARQFVGHGDECLEQTLWFGSNIADSSISVPDRQATWAPPLIPLTARYAQELAGFIVEAHATINRCQFIESFFAERNIDLIAPDVAYGITQALPEPSPLLTTYRIIESVPFSIRNLRTALKKYGWSNRTEIKKRNFPDDPEEIRKSLALPKHTHTSPFGVIFLFRYHNKAVAILAERLYDR